MSFSRALVESPRAESFRSLARLAYEIVGRELEGFTDLSSRLGQHAGCECEISYDGRVKIWQTVGRHKFTLNYDSRQVVFGALLRRASSGQWVDWDAQAGSELLAQHDTNNAAAQIVIWIMDNSPAVDMSLLDQRRLQPSAPSDIFSLDQTHKNFSRIKLQFDDTSSIQNWKPEGILSLIPQQTWMSDLEQQSDLLVTDDAEPTGKRYTSARDFIAHQVAIIEASEEHSYPLSSWRDATKAAFRTASSTNDSHLPLVSMFLRQGGAVRDILPFAEPDYSVDFSVLDDLDYSQRRVIRNIFNHQVSLVHAPAGSGLVSAIVSVTEAILRKAPQTKILICGYDRSRLDEISDGFMFRECFCDFRFQHLHLPLEETLGIEGSRVILCTYSESRAPWLKKIWAPHVLIASDAGMITHYDLLTPISAHFDSLTRLVLLGDHRQFGPYTRTDKDKPHEGRSMLEELMEEQWPGCMLHLERMTHSDLCFPRSSVFYDGRLMAVRQTSTPGSFLTKMQDRFNAGLRIIDGDDDATSITSFAHFFDIWDPINLEGQSPVHFVDVLVKTLLWTEGCQMSQIMVVSLDGSSTNLHLQEATTRCWGDVKVHTVTEAQGLSAKVVICLLPLTKVELELAQTNWSKSACVIMSLATEMIYFVGKWRAVCDLDYSNDLQRCIFTLDEMNPRFLQRVGPSPYAIETPAGRQHSDGRGMTPSTPAESSSA
ncbi:hypothetical protein AYO21_09820 [Fonsecaea monophora]|uniref:Uncharacterized protein n=1 Tax=Fonsecaea monophora TaxID=254056 RepID=A0A177EXF8_9EURO|nr:hypothetical protein AYO21_09820 [Fonsecaea monophora]KAH0847046.1 hypothetical protein FOPE_11261 [Fonsecaea pedrosoi]OAG35960.1 hypothetical protein AYO21_09820 [Fonsecaea monophora]